ncbi:MAG: tripartite tricarboxylate transporter TctB family protein [Pseudothermotoga elfii]|nr:MAG: Putative tricarboxylic transport membrane protein [Pseudothermotoga lettingae]GLI49050.1 hypothetical protein PLETTINGATMO_12190 [Pseudothermotoga lettingae TMO]
MTSRKNDFLSGLIVSILGLVFFLGTIGIKPVKLGLSPADFPRLITVSMMILGVVLLIKGLLVKNDETKKKSDTSVFLKLICLVVMLFAYILLMDKIGFLYLTPFLIFSCAYLFGMKNLWLNIVLSIVVTISVYYVFSQVFKIPLPRFSL